MSLSKHQLTCQNIDTHQSDVYLDHLQTRLDHRYTRKLPLRGFVELKADYVSQYALLTYAFLVIACGPTPVHDGVHKHLARERVLVRLRDLPNCHDHQEENDIILVMQVSIVLVEVIAQLLDVSALEVTISRCGLLVSFRGGVELTCSK
jgi:hypothetical protein